MRGQPLITLQIYCVKEQQVFLCENFCCPHHIQNALLLQFFCVCLEMCSESLSSSLPQRHKINPPSQDGLKDSYMLLRMSKKVFSYWHFLLVVNAADIYVFVGNSCVYYYCCVECVHTHFFNRLRRVFFLQRRRNLGALIYVSEALLWALKERFRDLATFLWKLFKALQKLFF